MGAVCLLAGGFAVAASPRHREHVLQLGATVWGTLESQFAIGQPSQNVGTPAVAALPEFREQQAGSLEEVESPPASEFSVTEAELEPDSTAESATSSVSLVAVEDADTPTAEPTNPPSPMPDVAPVAPIPVAVSAPTTRLVVDLPKACVAGTCPANKFGTALSWVPDPESAAKQAKDEGKLLFVLQVSGNFAREEFT